MTKNELLSFIAFKNEQEKKEAEFYMAVKGVELHCRILDYLGCDFEKSKIEWPKIANVLRTDKALRDIIYKYLATLEEYIRAFISNKYIDSVQQKFWIDGTSQRQEDKIKTNIASGKNLFDVLEDTNFGSLIQQVKNLPDGDKKLLLCIFFGAKIGENPRSKPFKKSHKVFVLTCGYVLNYGFWVTKNTVLLRCFLSFAFYF